jgi:hypothetical protein
MPGLSFREFLYFEQNLNFPTYSFNQIIDNHIDIAVEIMGKTKPLAYFKDYLNYGYYPFYLENRDSFHRKLDEIILTVLEIDIPQFALIQPGNIIYLKKLLKIISNSVPFKPNMKSLSERTGISLNTLKHYIKLLNDAEILKLLYFENKGINSINKPEKIYLNNTTLMYNQGDTNVNIGNIRETFFYNQLNVNHNVNASKKADFTIDNQYTFEIGGKNKTQKQITDVQNAFIVKDDIEVGNDNIIPHWLIGVMY